MNKKSKGNDGAKKNKAIKQELQKKTNKPSLYPKLFKRPKNLDSVSIQITQLKEWMDAIHQACERLSLEDSV